MAVSALLPFRVHDRQIAAKAPPPVPDLPYACPFCDFRFALRKHRGTHIAERHGLPSPARLFSYHPACLVCLRYYHTIARLQRHLKGSPSCLRRTCLLVPPMDVRAIAAAEAAENQKARSLRAGHWQGYAAALPVLLTAGPAQPTRDELRQLLDDDAPLSLLADPPANTAFLCWALEPATAPVSRRGLRPRPSGIVGSVRLSLAICLRA
eukprot:s1597_g10.t1